MSFRFFSKNQFFFLFKIPNMNNQQGIQWGREGYERGRTKKQRQEDYRNALQRQMRERDQSRRRRRGSGNNAAVEKTNSAEQLRKITREQD